jgi:oligopeptide/dipeptide ABC transporter ATP-binding protein
MDDALRIDDLVKEYPVGGGRHRALVRAVDGVSLRVRRGETLALVGESGSGKTTTALCAVALERPTSGEVWIDGREVTSMPSKELRSLRRQAQYIFQDPFASLNPRMSVREIVREPLDIHRVGDSAGRDARVAELLGLVGLAGDAAARSPHQFSGGQRQRIGIARALALSPGLLVCDEPVSALDVSVQAQVINLLMDLQDERGLAYLFIAHDLAVVRQIAHRVAVMYLGRIVEEGTADEICAYPRHPYTVALMSAAPARPGRGVRRERIVLAGDPPSPIDPPSGCAFHTRCWKANDSCRTVRPPLFEVEPGHAVACHFPVRRDTELG